ncbi:hypothetical protein EDC96DRAFT_592749 [Choanephora cucurbitarum]|nr:hypothetical protein EDC96DRAFT_592749 [Choanephora cucurbitarum]
MYKTFFFFLSTSLIWIGLWSVAIYIGLELPLFVSIPTSYEYRDFTSVCKVNINLVVIVTSIYRHDIFVKPIEVDEVVKDSLEDVAIEEDKNQEQQAEVEMADIPLELEIRLKKENKRKRKFKPITSNKRRKDCT